ncbi:hypothetical protein ACOMHN_033644 [Nucella lapillus]
MAENKLKTKETEGGTGEAVEFNLSDPEQLARQLERVDLTEEESDELLREAYKVNKQLKMILKQKQDNIAASLRSQSASSSTSSTPSQKGGRSILPPINAKGGRAVSQRSLKAYGHSSGKSGGGGTAASAKPQSKMGKAKSLATQRPGWDDRFSFS